MKAAAPASAFDGWCSEEARNVGASDVNRPNAAKPTPAPSAAPKYSPARGGGDGDALRPVGGPRHAGLARLGRDGDERDRGEQADEADDVRDRQRAGHPLRQQAGDQGA